VKQVSIIKIEVVCRNYAAGSLVKRYGMEEGKKLNSPIIEYYYKDDALGDPLFTEAHIREMGLAETADLERINELTYLINELLSAFFGEKGILLVDFKLEFGRDSDGNIILADEISPDTCRLWDSETHKKLDKDRFRFDLGEVEDAYWEIYNRISS
ncbi:MAG TPA: phosphoribosylaminoimidazolesuccinocarboxamide synthase, partial [Ignavibacteria bacterium]|nr:phosphoribosylaminoimidazolesuccinocarboxamide synthase [Ignavibacteria bacterium]